MTVSPSRSDTRREYVTEFTVAGKVPLVEITVNYGG